MNNKLKSEKAPTFIQSRINSIQFQKISKTMFRTIFHKALFDLFFSSAKFCSQLIFHHCIQKPTDFIEMWTALGFIFPTTAHEPVDFIRRSFRSGHPITLKQILKINKSAFVFVWLLSFMKQQQFQFLTLTENILRIQIAV